jgi:hypothetical protein
MAKPVDPTKLTAKEEAKLRAQFTRDGREAVRQKLFVGAYSFTREGEAAARWLREKEIEQEARERKVLEYAKWAWDAALAAAVLAAIAVVLVVMALPQERIKAIEESGAELVKAAKWFGQTLRQ